MASNKPRTSCPGLGSLSAIGLGIACLGIALVLSGPAAAQSDPLERALSPNEPLEERRLAASEAFRSTLERDEVRLLSRQLARAADDATRRMLLEVIASMPLVPAELDEPIIGIVGLGSPELRPLALSALSSTTTRRAARVLVNHSAPHLPDETTRAAMLSLARMSGRADLGFDHLTWSDWLASVDDLSEEAWQTELARGLRGRADTLERDIEGARVTTADIYKRHFRVVPFQDRDGLLAEMLRAEGTLQDLGIELLYREIAGNRQIGPQVGEAALGMLGSARVETRSEAARLVATLQPQGAGTRLTRALEIEPHPVAAKALLQSLKRWARVAAVPPALRWLEFGPATRDEAASLLLSLDAEGLVTAPEDRRRIAAALRDAGIRRLTGDGLRLAVRMGTDDDRDAIANLVERPDAPERSAAASALAARPEFAGRIIAAAALDGALYPAAVTATVKHRPSPAGYAALRQLPAPTPTAARTGLLAVARVLSVEDVIEVVSVHEVDKSMQIAVLSTVAGVAASPGEFEAFHRSRVLLAATHLDLSQPEQALTSLAQATGTSSDDLRDEMQHLRVAALLWLNRIEEAEALEAGAEVWLSAIERFSTEPHAPQVADAILRRFDSVLQQSETERLRALAAVAEAPAGDRPTTPAIESPTDSGS
ncbi:MAG: hypothetical protein AAFR96_06610 [Planctomycetota bacterium]